MIGASHTDEPRLTASAPAQKYSRQSSKSRMFATKRDEIRRALQAAGRDPAAFRFAAQLTCGTTPADRHRALITARAFVKAGAGHVILGLPASLAPDGIRVLVDEVVEPLLDR